MLHLIFDLDGTLLNSSECIMGVYKKLFQELNLPTPDISVLRSFIGPPIEHVIKDYVKEEDIKATCTHFREVYKTFDLGKVNSLYDGVETLLKSLSKDYKLYLATTKNEFTAKKILDIFNISQYFTGAFGSRHDLNRLHKVQVLEELINTYGIDKNECILIGDTHYDAEGAFLANIPVCIVNYGFGIEEELAKYDILFRADNLSILEQKIRAL